MEPVTTVRYWAAIKEAAGVAEETVEAQTVTELLEVLRRRHDARFARVLERCSLLLDGRRVTGDAALAAGAEVDCLPPFAGG